MKILFRYLIIVVPIICTTYCTNSETIAICPIEKGTVLSESMKLKFAHSVYGEGSPKKTFIKGDKGAKVYSISEGVVERISKKSVMISNSSDGKSYTYFGVLSQLKTGTHLKKGSIIGTLKDDYLIFSVKDERQHLASNKYISCNCRDYCLE